MNERAIMKARALRYTKAAPAGLSYYEITSDIQDMTDDCYDTVWALDNEEVILNVLDGNEDELNEYRLLFNDMNKKYPACEFFDWHSKLTGSCLPGRQAFAAARGIDIDTAEYTVSEFIALTKNAWGGVVIRELESKLKGGLKL